MLFENYDNFSDSFSDSVVSDAVKLLASVQSTLGVPKCLRWGFVSTSFYRRRNYGNLSEPSSVVWKLRALFSCHAHLTCVRVVVDGKTIPTIIILSLLSLLYPCVHKYYTSCDHCTMHMIVKSVTFWFHNIMCNIRKDDYLIKYVSLTFISFAQYAFNSETMYWKA